jgi:Hemerythrin HHE cation binding domain
MSLRDEIQSLLDAPAMNVDDVRTLLRVDHDEALQLARDMVDAEDAEARRALLRQLVPALKVHAQAAKCTVYESLRLRSDLDGGRAMVDGRLSEHRALEVLLAWLARSRKSGSDEWHARAKELLSLVVRHVEAEQDSMFKLMGEHFDHDELTRLGRRFVAAKARAAGTMEASRGTGRHRSGRGMGAAI